MRFPCRIPVSQRNYSGFSSYTSLLNQLANKLLDKKARLIIKKTPITMYYLNTR
jgi:hypothetical protein